MSPTQRAEVEGLLIQGMEVKEITAKTKVSRAQVYNIRTELHATRNDNNIHVLANATPEILASVANGIRDRAPVALEGEVEKLLDAAQSLQKLETSFHASFDNVLAKANEMLKQDNLSIIDWQIITNTLSSAFKDIYHTKGTTINVGQAGSVGGNSLSMFQSRMSN